MSGFAAGVQAGLAMSNQWMDTYRRARREGLMSEVDNERSFQTYSQPTADQMRAESEERNPDGSYKYRFEIDPGSTTYRRVVNDYNPQDFRTNEYTPALRYPDAQGGLGPQPSAVAESFPVNRSTVQVREDYNAYPGSVLAGGAPKVAPGSIQYGGTPVPMDSPEQGGSRDLLTNAPEYSPALNVSDPRDTAAYQAMTAPTPGQVGTYSPDREMYFGKSYGLGQLTPEEKRAVQQEQYARVYERLGQPEQALALRSAAAKERRDAEMFGLQKEATQLQLSEAKRSVAQREGANNVSMALSELEKNGQPVTAERILQIGAAYGLSPGEAGKVFVERNGVNQAIYENTKVLRAQLAQNVNTLSQAKMAFNNNPIFADGTEMDYATTADGRVVVTQKNKADGRVLYTSPPMMEGQAVALLKQRIMDPIAAENFAMTVTTHNMNLLKDQALINKYNAEARAAGVDTKSVGNMVNYQRSLQDQLEKLDAGLQALDPKSPAFAKEIERRKRLSELLEVTNAKLATEFNLGVGGNGGNGGGKERVTRNGKTFEFQGGDRNDPKNWAEIPAGAPAAAAPAPAKGGIGPEKPKAAPAIKAPAATGGMTDKQYEDWINEKLMGPLSGPSKYQEIARTHPDKKVREAAQRLYDRYLKAREE